MAFDKSVFEFNELFIHFKLFKLFHIFHLFDPKCKKLWNFNVYHLAWYAVNCVIGCTITFGLMGYFTEMEDVFNIINHIQIISCNLTYYLCLVKSITFFYKANDIWNLLNVTRIHFMTSTQCQKHFEILHKYRKKLIKITNYIIIFASILAIQWFLYPLLMMLLHKEHANQSNQRFENIINLQFPVTISYYNNNFVIFYIIELSITLVLLYMYLLSEVFFISLCFAFIAQYEVIKITYENVNSELNSKNNNGKYK
jgi:hypothetical protein